MFYYSKNSNRNSISVTIFLTLYHVHFFSPTVCMFVGFPAGSDGRESACNVGDPGQSFGCEDSLEKEMATHSKAVVVSVPTPSLEYACAHRRFL